jgi:tetratricopeptide (TPR) repeat protein
LACTTFAVYSPVLSHDFVKYDDDKRITENRNVTAGLTRRSLVWVFTSFHFHMWHPLTSLSHILDCQLFDLNPTGHHLTSLLLHLAGTLLLFGILKRMTGALWPSAFVAAAFAFHPLNVESVAWVAERMNVLSGFFWILTIAVYVRYAERPGMCRLSLLVLVFGLSIMTKAMVVTLPFVLLLLDYWPLARMRGLTQNQKKEPSPSKFPKARFQQAPWWLLIAEKIPLFILSSVLSLITFIAQQRGGTMSGLENIPLKFRIANAAVSYVTYIEKMFWPSRLAVFYPHPGRTVSLWYAVLAALVLVAVSACVIRLARRRKYLPVGWFWYLGTLVPVIGLVQVGAQARADRYAYLPFIGLFIITAWGLSDLVARWRHGKAVLAVSAVGALIALSVCTRLQLRHWRDSFALFERTLGVTSNNFIMHNNYGNVLNKMGRTDKAVNHFRMSLRIKPDSFEAHNNLGNALRRLRRLDDALAHYKKALALNANFAEAHYNMAMTLADKGKIDEAVAEYREALRFTPDDVDTLSNLGYELAKQRRFDEAIECYRKALAVERSSVITHGRLGLALAGKGKLDDAIREFRIVLSIQPNDVEMYCNVGILLEQQGKIDQAISEYRRALNISPGDPKALNALEAALAKQQNRP